METEKEEGVKLFVLDTNVLMHDHSALFNFGNNNILIPFTTMEELDKLKNGNSSASHEARAASRTLRNLLEKFNGNIEDGVPLNIGIETVEELGKLFFSNENDESLMLDKNSYVNDNLIIKAAKDAKKDSRFKDSKVILVSKDNNVFVKCVMLKIACEDYKTDRVNDQYEALLATTHIITEKEWDLISAKVKIVKGKTFTLPIQKRCIKKNEYVVVHNGKSELHGIVTSFDAKTFTFEILDNYKKGKGVFRVLAKNDKQNFVLNILLNPNIDIVAVTGNAGSGKTLLTLASGFHHLEGGNSYHKIIATRALIPLGDDIGFLPGDEKEKVLPWMGAFTDNMEFLTSNKVNPADKDIKPLVGLKELQEKLEVKSINFMRGRTFHDKYVIIDEAQNLTLPQIKAIVSRAGQGTKVVLLGNTDQIDTPYLTPESSGLTVLIHRFRGEENFASMHLDGVIRSKLAEQADRLL